MTTTIRKLYFNAETEEKWLNKLSAKGLQLKHYSFCKYEFEEGTPGEYIYRIELLENQSSHAESKAYFKFLEDSNIEVVSTYLRWVFLRKRASDGPFDIYSDSDSKIAYYKRLMTFYSLLVFMLITTNANNMVNFITSLFKYGITNKITLVTGSIGLLNLSLTLLLIYLVVYNYLKLRKIKKDKKLFE